MKHHQETPRNQRGQMYNRRHSGFRSFGSASRMSRGHVLRPLANSFHPSFPSRVPDFSDALFENRRPRGNGRKKHSKNINNGNDKELKNSLEEPKEESLTENVGLVPLQVFPRNGMSCLMDIDSQVNQTVSFRSISHPDNCQIASIKFKDCQIEGYGSTSELAIDSVSDNALRTLVENPDPTINFHVDIVKDQDLNIWKSIISYSLYKMFNDWGNNRIGLLPHDNWLESTGMGKLNRQVDVAPISSALADFVNNAKKKLPSNPDKYHPSMLLNNIIPNYIIKRETTSEGNTKMILDIEGMQFTGTGKNPKLARARLGYKFFKILFKLETNASSEMKIDI